MPDRIGVGHLESRVIVRSVKEFLLHEAGAETADGNGDSFVVGDYSEGILVLDATAIEGTSVSATFKLQTKVNSQWVDVPGVTIAAITAVAVQAIAIANFGDEIRLAWDLNATTTSITFSASFMAKT